MQLCSPPLPTSQSGIGGVQRGVCSSSVLTEEIWRQGYIAVLIGGILFAGVVVYEEREREMLNGALVWADVYVYKMFLCGWIIFVRDPTISFGCNLL